MNDNRSGISADPADEADRLSYFSAVYKGFRRAEAATEQVCRYYNVGDLSICLRFAGEALLTQLGPALAHLETAAITDPALTICLWDSASTGTKLPLLVGSMVELLRLRWWEQLDGRREIKQYSSGRIRSTFHLGPDILSVLDTTANLAVYWIADAAATPYYERGYPLQAILNMWTVRHARHYVHAAAVGTSAGGVLLAGPSGSGKSTTTLACLGAELGVAADDYTLLSLEPEPRGYSLYNTVKLRTRQDMEKFPAYLSQVDNADRLDEDKPMLMLQQHYPKLVLRSFPLRALLLPQVIGGSETRLRPASALITLRLLAPSTLLQLPGSGQDSFRALSNLVKRVPAYHLELGTDLAQIPGVIARLLGELS